MLADVTSYLIDHLTALAIIVALIVGGLVAFWMLLVFLLGWHRYPEN